MWVPRDVYIDIPIALQSSTLSTEKWIRKMCHLHTVQLLSSKAEMFHISSYSHGFPIVTLYILLFLKYFETVCTNAYGITYVRGDWQSRSLHTKLIHSVSYDVIIFLCMCVCHNFFICSLIDGCLGDPCETRVAAFINVGLSF